MTYMRCSAPVVCKGNAHQCGMQRQCTPVWYAKAMHTNVVRKGNAPVWYAKAMHTSVVCEGNAHKVCSGYDAGVCGQSGGARTN